MSVLYIHGGGLYVGEADNEELSSLRILKATSGIKEEVNDTKAHPPLIKEVFLLTYRLMPTHSAQDSLSLSVRSQLHPQPTQVEQHKEQTHPSREFLWRPTRRPPLTKPHRPRHNPRRPPPLFRNQRRLQRPRPLRPIAFPTPAHQRLGSFLLELAARPDEAGGATGRAGEDAARGGRGDVEGTAEDVDPTVHERQSVLGWALLCENVGGGRG